MGPLGYLNTTIQPYSAMRKISLLICLLVILFSSIAVAQDSSPTPTDKQIQVFVAGSVGRSGIYFLPTNATLLDAIKAAGGFHEDARNVRLRRHDTEGRGFPFAEFTVKDVRDCTKNVALIDRDMIRVEGKPSKPEF